MPGLFVKIFIFCFILLTNVSVLYCYMCYYVVIVCVAYIFTNIIFNMCTSGIMFNGDQSR